jgi:hypothetical protein
LLLLRQLNTGSYNDFGKCLRIGETINTYRILVVKKILENVNLHDEEEDGK